MESKTYTENEVKKHNKSNDCWIIIEDNVCNITEFLDEHPGGPDIILGNAGTDCTSEFKDIGHSKDAKVLVQKYTIGKLKK